MDHMDWYCDTDGDNLLFLKDQEQLNGPTEEEYWWQFGITESPKEYCATVPNSTAEKHRLHSQSLSNEAAKEISMQEGENFSDSSNYAGIKNFDYGRGIQDSSLNQLEGLGRIDQMDDIFLSSLLEKEPPFMVTPPLTTWDEVEDTSTFFIQSDLDQTKSFSMMMASTEENSSCTEDCEEKSVEESILHELEVVITQLSQNTRICFRDALYRLAKSSEHRHLISLSQSGEVTMDKPSLMAVDNETSRMRCMETETNVIDRTIANLMFNKLK